jgi:hypothetical protein
MRLRAHAAIVVVALICCASFAFAQNPQAGPPAPGPEVKKLAAFAGRWTEQADMKPSPMGPGGKFTGTENCEWTVGGFALMCRETTMMPGMGNASGISLMGYDADAKNYVYTEMDSFGQVQVSRGTVEGDNWTWTSDATMGGQNLHMKFTMNFTSKDAFDMKFEAGQSANSMQMLMEGKATRVAGRSK